MQEIARIAEASTTAYTPMHEVTDPAKVLEIAADMAAHGWRGAPLLVDGDDALTGTHRLAAIRHLWGEQGLEVAALVVTVDEVLDVAGLDRSDLECCDDAYERTQFLAEVLPSEMTVYLGLDAH